MKQNKPGAAFGVKAETGLSLKELLVTLIITLLGNLVIIMIVLAIALLSFQRAYNSFRLSGAARDVRDIVWIARSEAINRNKSVDLVVQTSSSDPTRTNIWTDPDRDGKLDPGEKVFLLGPQENLIDSSGVPGTASLLLQAVNGAGAATPLPTSSKITFDARGSVTQTARRY